MESRTKYIYDRKAKIVDSPEIVKTLNEFDKDLKPIIDKMYNKISKENYDRIQLENFIKERISSNLMCKFVKEEIR